MKVNQGPYVNWIGPYQIAEKICFWVKRKPDELGIHRKEDWVHDFGTWLAEDKNGNDSWLMKACLWFQTKQKRKMKVHIHRYDTWSMDSNLACIILPMLKQVKDKKQGSPFVEDSDVPEELRSTNAPAKENEWDTDDNFHKRWDWVLDEMIWAFEQIHPDNEWEEQYRSGVIDIKWEPCETDSKGETTLYSMVRGSNDTYKCDYEGMKKHQERITSGTTLFGKYFQSLSD